MLPLLSQNFFPGPSSKPKTRLGFTLIELLIACAIIAVLASLVTINLPGFRVDRNLNIAQNELVTNLRKAQSYTLSAHEVAPGQSGQFFILKFDGSVSGQNSYTLQALYNIGSSPASKVDVETYQLPPGIRVSSTPVTIFVPSPTQPPIQATVCSLVSFKSPFARVYLNAGCNVSSPPFQPLTDDYQNLINFVTNTNNYHTTSDSYAIITLLDATGAKSRQVMIRGVSGVICPAVYNTSTSSYQCSS